MITIPDSSHASIMNLRLYALVPAVLGTTLLGALPMARAADPTTADCLAANNAAIDLRNDHKLRAARNQLLVCAANSCPADIRKECLRKVDEVNAQIPTVAFEAKDAAGKDLSAVKVAMDGQPFAERLEGTALSVDPGEHTFTFETEGQPRVTRQFVIQEAQKERREAISFGTPIQSPAPAPLAVTTPSHEPAHGLPAQKITAIVIGAVGVVGLGVGGAFGLVAMSKKGDAQSACPGLCTTQDGVNKWNDAATAGNLSTGFFIGGVVALASGVVLWITAPSAHAPSAQIALGPGSIRVTGTWQ